MFTHHMQAATITTGGSGSWTSTTNNAPWPGGVVPSPGDSIIIGSGHTLTVNTAATCLAIYFAVNGSASTLTISGTNSLTVTNDITFSIPSGNVRQLVAIGSGLVSCTNLTYTLTGSNNKDNDVTISTGSFTASGNISMPASASRNSFVCSGTATVTVGGSWTNSGTVTPSTSTIVYNGASAQSILGITYNKLVLSGAGTKSFGGNVTVSDTLTISAGARLNNSESTNLRTDGVFYVLGEYNETATGGSVTFNGGVNIATGGTISCTIGETFIFSAGGLINNGMFACGTSNTSIFQTNAQSISGSGTTTFSTLTVNVGVTNNTTITVATALSGSNTLTQGLGAVLNIGGSSGISVIAASANANTVNYNANGAQTVKGTTYRNLILSVSGAKTTSSVTVNDTLFMEGTATASTAPTYGSAATLTYNTATARNTANEWISPFTASGGVVISSTGTITLIAAKQLGNNTNAPLTIQSGATLSTGVGNFGLTFHGNFVNNGTLSAGSSAITIGGTVTSQSIAGFTTSGLVSLTKTAGTATLTGAISGEDLTINGSGGTLNLGSSLNHTFSGDITLTAGTLNGGTSTTLNVTSSAATAWAGTGSNFDGNTGMVNFNGTNQSINTATTFYNLTFNNSGAKTLAASVVVNGTLTIAGSATFAIGANTLTLNGNVSGLSTNPIIGGSSSNVTIGGSGSIGNLFFSQTTPGTSNNIATFTVNRSGQTVALGNNLDVSISLTLTAGNLAINGQTLTLKGTNVSSVANSLVGSATSNLAIAGSGSMNPIFFDTTIAGTTNLLANLTYNRSGQTIPLGNTLNVTGVLTPTAGTLASGGFLTLVSYASGTARIANGGCTSCSYITGNVTIQRYVPAVARRYRFMGSTVQSTTLADWKNEIYVTGAGGTNNGFDATATNAPSVYSYNETIITGDLNTGWVASASTAEVLTPGKGYRVFVRGDRSNSARLTGTLGDQNQVTMNVVGVPNQGNIVVPISYTSSGVVSNDGWNLVSNPYASPYDWNAHYDDSSTHSNIDPVIMILSAQSGGYVSYNTNADAGSLTYGIIPAGASFWIKANAANPTLIFKEQYKTSGTPVSLFKTSEGENFNIRLQYDSITFDDVTVKYITGSTASYDAYDIRKLAGTVTISAYGNDNVHLALSSRPLAATVDTIKLYVNGAAGAYQLRFTNNEAIAIADNVLLFDTYTSTVTDLKTTAVYRFNIVSGAPASTGLNRFYIVVGSSSSLPVKLLHFTARKTDNKQVTLNWATAQETNSKSFEVERSADGKTFTTITTLAAGGNTHALINYETTDEQPARVNYYRLKQVDLGGAVSYSQVQYIMMEEVAGAKLYPVPAHTTLTIEHTNVLTSVRVFDISGRVMSTQTGFGSIATIDVSALETGVYVIEYTDETGQTYKEKFTKE
ncbi:MAG: T9SS type A sorting domain-containing protein [Bacteroidota bacterium]